MGEAGSFAVSAYPAGRNGQVPALMGLLISAAFGPAFQGLGFHTAAPQPSPALPGCLEKPGPLVAGKLPEVVWHTGSQNPLGALWEISPHFPGFFLRWNSPGEMNHDWRCGVTTGRLGRRGLRGLHVKGLAMTRLQSMEADVYVSIAAPRGAAA